jgi:hypothetical protein
LLTLTIADLRLSNVGIRHLGSDSTPSLYGIVNILHKHISNNPRRHRIAHFVRGYNRMLLYRESTIEFALFGEEITKLFMTWKVKI